MLRRRRGTMLDLRRENRAAVLWSLYFSRPGSRQDLSAATGLSTTSVTNVVRELIDDGIVIEVGSEGSDGGRPRMLLDINPNHRYAIGVDVGETYGWEAVPLERLLRAHTGLPLRFENCAKNMGQAELWFGAARGA